MSPRKAAIIGSGNIGTDLMMKILKSSGPLQLGALVGIDPHSEGLRRATAHGVKAIDTGVTGLVASEDFADYEVVFDATSAQTHLANYEVLRNYGVKVIDLTPAAIGPFVVPAVNLEVLSDEQNVNMVTCGGQATIPIVAAVNHIAPVAYAEIIASIASRSAGQGTRANIDEFTKTTSRAIERVGGAAKGKAIIVLNPADPPMIMRDTVYCLVEECDDGAVNQSIQSMTGKVQEYVGGYRLKQEVQFRTLKSTDPLRKLVPPTSKGLSLVSVFLEVEGAGDYLPRYAGNLDIMTSAALRVGELVKTSKARGVILR